jgi:hypothetical protein
MAEVLINTLIISRVYIIILLIIWMHVHLSPHVSIDISMHGWCMCID